MATIQLVYATDHQHTAEVAARIAKVLKGRGHQARLHRLDGHAPLPDLTAMDALVVGGSVHRGEHQQALVAFVRSHRDLLRQLPNAFFSVSLAAGLPGEENRAQAAKQLSDFERMTGWHPEDTELVGGCLAYTRYGWFQRQLMRWIANRAGASQDTSRDHVYTDWGAVERFAEDLARKLEAREHRQRPPPVQVEKPPADEVKTASE